MISLNRKSKSFVPKFEKVGALPTAADRWLSVIGYPLSVNGQEEWANARDAALGQAWSFNAQR
jgi:hypothetical protein